VTRLRTLRERAELEAEQARLVARALAEAPAGARLLPRSPPGDPRSLRGIPVIGHGAGGGTIPGTDPLAAVLAREHRRSRRHTTGT
jgi:hypothetical protein